MLSLSKLLISKQFLLLRQIIYYLQVFPKFINFGVITRYQIQLHLNKKYLNIFLHILKYHWYSQYKTLVDIICLDFVTHNSRFTLYYGLLSYKYNNRLDLITKTSFVNPIDSCVNLYPNANWLEREIWDMFGVFFHNHPDLRRILTDYGFLGFPLRKDFPLSGFVEVSYDDRKKSIIYKKNSFAQEFRNFYKISSWR